MTSSPIAYTDNRKPSKSDRPHSVYKYYDDLGILIYVGITCTGLSRNRQHNASKEWWRFVSSQEVEHFDCRDDAHAREVTLITEHRPPFNTQHNPDHADIRAAYLEMRHRKVDGGFKQIVATGLKKFIPLTRFKPRDNKRKIAFITQPDDAPIVGHIKKWDRDPFVLVGGNTVGRVVSVERTDVVSVFYALIRDYDPSDIGDGSARLKYLSQKKPYVVGLNHIIATPLVVEVSR